MEKGWEKGCQFKVAVLDMEEERAGQSGKGREEKEGEGLTYDDDLSCGERHDLSDGLLERDLEQKGRRILTCVR